MPAVLPGANDTFGAPGSPFNCSLCYEPPSPTGPNGTWTLGSKFWGIVALTVGWEALTRNASSLYGLCDAGERFSGSVGAD